MIAGVPLTWRRQTALIRPIVPVSEYSLSINFTCSPARVDELVKAMFKEIDGLETAGPSEMHTSDVRETMLRDYETNRGGGAMRLSPLPESRLARATSCPRPTPP